MLRITSRWLAVALATVAVIQMEMFVRHYGKGPDLADGPADKTRMGGEEIIGECRDFLFGGLSHGLL